MTVVGVTYQTILVWCCRVANCATLLMTFGMTLVFKLIGIILFKLDPQFRRQLRKEACINKINPLNAELNPICKPQLAEVFCGVFKCYARFSKNLSKCLHTNMTQDAFHD